LIISEPIYLPQPFFAKKKFFSLHRREYSESVVVCQCPCGHSIPDIIHPVW
jgi:hypothetical protein